VFCRAATDNETAKYKRAMFSAWHSAAFSRQKKMPDLSKVMRRFDADPPKAPSPDLLMQKMMLLKSAFGERKHG